MPFLRSATRAPKVIVIGAGPAGSACALELRRRTSAEITVIDRSTYPRRKVCGSGLSPHALTQLRALGMLDVLRPFHVEMSTLRAIGPGGLSVTLRGSKGAWVIPRTELDQCLIQAAVAEGVRFVEGARAKSIVTAPDGTACAVQTQDDVLEADLVVSATGSPSTFELETRPRDGVRTIMGWWEGRLPDDTAIMAWDRRLGGYYAWAFPEPGDVVNLGLTIADAHPRAHHLRDLFDELIEAHFRPIVGHREPIGRLAGHPATVTHRVGPVASRRQIVVGEAARLVCPGTVEGIAFALESGRLAAATISRSFRPERGLSMVGRQRYRAALVGRMVPMFAAGQSLRHVMGSPALCQRLASLVDPRWVARQLARLVGEQSSAV